MVNVTQHYNAHFVICPVSGNALWYGFLAAFDYSFPAFSVEVAIYFEYSFIKFSLRPETGIGLNGQAGHEKKEYTEKSEKLGIALYFHG
jgi:hypothetical protein